MKTSIVTTRLFGENIYIIWDETTLEAAIIDPGMMDENERQEVEDVVKQENLSVKYVLLTHSHIDHACSARWTAEKFGAQVYGSKMMICWLNRSQVKPQCFICEFRHSHSPSTTTSSKVTNSPLAMTRFKCLPLPATPKEA